MAYSYINLIKMIKLKTVWLNFWYLDYNDCQISKHLSLVFKQQREQKLLATNDNKTNDKVSIVKKIRY